MKNALFVISGPSGVGKGTLVKRLMEEDDSLALSISCTTRQPRVGERDGEHYFFVTEREFKNRIAENDFLEYDEHFGNYYGTPRSFVERRLKEKSVILEIDVVGGLNSKRLMPDAVLIFIAPPSMEELEKRLAGRGTETEKNAEDRLHRVKFEYEQQAFYDYVVVNDDFETAYAELRAIIEKEKNKV